MQNPTTQPVVVEVAPSGQLMRPITEAEMQVIRRQRSEMSNQISSAQSRREDLLDEIRSAPPGTEEGMRQQLLVLNDRIVNIEKDIEASGRTLRTGQVPVGTVLVPPRSGISALSEDTIQIMAMSFGFFVLLPIAIVFVRRMWVRGRRGSVTASAEQDARMERLEQAVDAIAIEIERVGESQRYQTKVLAEANLMPALNAGQRAAEPVRARE